MKKQKQKTKLCCVSVHKRALNRRPKRRRMKRMSGPNFDTSEFLTFWENTLFFHRKSRTPKGTSKKSHRLCENDMSFDAYSAISVGFAHFTSGTTSNNDFFVSFAVVLIENIGGRKNLQWISWMVEKCKKTVQNNEYLNNYSIRPLEFLAECSPLNCIHSDMHFIWQYRGRFTHHPMNDSFLCHSFDRDDNM